MMNKYNYLCDILEAKEEKQMLPYVLAYHNEPRNTDSHYDLRIVSPIDSENMMSWAIPKEADLKTRFPKEGKVVAFRTRQHPVKTWLNKSTYRIEQVEQAECEVITTSPKYMKLKFNGKIMKGEFVLFKLSGKRRNDVWLIKKV